jgi:Fur family ferric uptake transcriptional regulator
VAAVTAVESRSDQEQRIHRLIRDAGGRLTVTARTVVAILIDAHQHLTAEDIIDEAQRRAPGIAPSTVYRLLQRLEELGAVEHIHSGHGPTFYHLGGQGHVHLLCGTCGTIIDIPERLLAPAVQRVHRAHGFTIDLHHAALIGRCATCAARSPLAE